MMEKITICSPNTTSFSAWAHEKKEYFPAFSAVRWDSQNVDGSEETTSRPCP